MSMDANALERETLERKDREELAKIVAALGGKATSRTRKSDLVDQIFELTGVTTAPAADAAGGDAVAPADAEPQLFDQGTDAALAGSEVASVEPAAAQDHADADSDAAGGEDRGAEERAPRPAGNADRNQTRRPQRPAPAPPADRAAEPSDASDAQGDGNDGDGGSGDDNDPTGKRRRRRGRNRDGGGAPEEFVGEPIPVAGCLDLRDDGYGFLRVDGLLPSRDDCYVSVKQVRQFGLRKGDVITGGSRPAFRNEKNPAMLRIDTVNGVELEPGVERPLFDALRAITATEPIRLEIEDEPGDLSVRAIDLLAPVAKGSRVLVLGGPGTGKSLLLQDVARAVEINQPDATLMVVLIDERPEEITDMTEVVSAGLVVGSALDAPYDDHVALTELAMARARRVAEAGDDVIVLIDGLSRLARAEHAAYAGVGRTLGGLDVSAIHAVKRCFGAGRRLDGAGSITVIATADVDTGSSEDEAVVDAVLGAATSVIALDLFSAANRVFPAFDVVNTSTRRPERIVGDDGAAARDALRDLLAELPDGGAADQAGQLDSLLGRLRDSGSNDELLAAAVRASGDRA